MLTPVPSEAMPPASADASVRAAQAAERAFWMQRDLAQAETLREACMKQAELVGLIRANNAGPER